MLGLFSFFPSCWLSAVTVACPPVCHISAVDTTPPPSDLPSCAFQIALSRAINSPSDMLTLCLGPLVSSSPCPSKEEVISGVLSGSHSLHLCRLLLLTRALAILALVAFSNPAPATLFMSDSYSFSFLHVLISSINLLGYYLVKRG